MSAEKNRSFLTDVADGFRLLDVGEFALKGVAAPVRIIEATRTSSE